MSKRASPGCLPLLRSIYVNDAWCAATGIGRDAALGAKGYWDLFSVTHVSGGVEKGREEGWLQCEGRGGEGGAEIEEGHRGGRPESSNSAGRLHAPKESCGPD